MLMFRHQVDKNWVLIILMIKLSKSDKII